MTKAYEQPAAEVADYLVKRARREAGEAKSEEVAKAEAGEQDAGERLLELLNQKEDLLATIHSSEATAGSVRSELSPSDILEALKAGDFSVLARPVSADHGIKSSIGAGRQELEVVNAEISGLLASVGAETQLADLLEEKIKLAREAKNVERLKRMVENIGLAEAKLLAHRNNEDTKLTAADRKISGQYEEIVALAQEKVAELLTNPDTFREVNRRELLAYRRQLLSGGFVETDSKKVEINQILAHLQLGMPVFLRGHLGAGKTEDCLHISRKYYGVEPEFISGSEEATKYDIYGKIVMNMRSFEDREASWKLCVEEFQNRFPGADESEVKKMSESMYRDVVINGKIESYFQYGPLVRAMKEGKPIVIDEIDAIPHSILIRLNHILTRRPGGKVKIQENGGEEIVIKPGFCVMATGNIKSAKYKREDLDAAFLSRWWSTEVKYLPPDETFKIIAAGLVDKRCNPEVGAVDFDAAKRLADAASEIQKIFAGEKLDVFGEGGDAARGQSASLEKSVLSMRDLANVLAGWKAANFKRPLEDFILNDFIRKATVPKDQVYLTQIFCRYDFFKSKDWDLKKFGIPGLAETVNGKTKLDAFRSAK